MGGWMVICCQVNTMQSNKYAWLVIQQKWCRWCSKCSQVQCSECINSVKFHKCPHQCKICCLIHLKGCTGLPTLHCFMLYIQLFHRLNCVSIRWHIMAAKKRYPLPSWLRVMEHFYIFKLTPLPEVQHWPQMYLHSCCYCHTQVVPPF